MSEQAIFATCAWRLIPFMAALYLVSYIDRENVRFALAAPFSGRCERR